MTERQFWKLLATLNEDNWIIHKDGRIRRLNGDCPLVAGAKKVRPECRIGQVNDSKACDILELNNTPFGIVLVDAADNTPCLFTEPYMKTVNKIRKKLVRTLGLELQEKDWKGLNK